MNIEYADTIPMRTVLSKLSLQPSHQEDRFLLYASPFRDNGEPTLRINLRANRWADSFNGLNGGVVEFLCLYFRHINKPASVKDALDWLRQQIGYVVLNCPEQTSVYVTEDRKYHYKDHGMVVTPNLIDYLEKQRCIPLDHARFLLREVRLLNTETGKTFSVLGMANDEGGIAIRNPYVKANVRPLYTTFIRGRSVKPSGIHIFKDFFDFLSVQSRRNGKPFDDDVIILNHLSMMKLSSAFIRDYGYKYACTWLDNTNVGKEATQLYHAFLKTQHDLKHYPMNRIYNGYKDVNDWHCNSSLQHTSNSIPSPVDERISTGDLTEAAPVTN